MAAGIQFFSLSDKVKLEQCGDLVFVSHIPVQAVSAVPCQVLRAILISLASCEFLAFSIFSTSFYKIERSVKSGGAYLCPAIVLIDSAFPKMLNL